MRLFEATGMGSLLLTDKKDNLNKMYINYYSVYDNRYLKVNSFILGPGIRTFPAGSGRKFHIESEFEVKNKQIRRPGTKH